VVRDRFDIQKQNKNFAGLFMRTNFGSEADDRFNDAPLFTFPVQKTCFIFFCVYIPNM